ncbi:MAG: UbiD family decarboxylase, partial [Candidatus Omnitrophica bacterium]|nr:UbiD family decarboxylase [Candidatus Omnitrophota bacterium]
EWAMATRFQASRGIVNMGRSKGSSLDPSSNPETRETDKMGFDFTKPVEVKHEKYNKAEFPKVDIKKFLGE